MLYLGFPYLKGKTGGIDTWQIPQAKKDTIGAGLCVHVLTNATVDIFDGTKPFFGVTGMDRKVLCLSSNIPMKSIILSDAYDVGVQYSGSGDIVPGSPVYLQDDGSVSDTDAGFGFFLATHENEDMIDWDDTVKPGILSNLHWYGASATAPPPDVSGVMKENLRVTTVSDASKSLKKGASK